MSDIFGRIRSGAGKVAKEADRVARVKRIELQIGSIKRQRESYYGRLGEMAYNSYVNNEPENPEATDIVAKITQLNQQIRVKEEEIKRINSGDIQPQTTQVSQAPLTPGKRLCPNCGHENDADVKFCSECGAKMD